MTIGARLYRLEQQVKFNYLNNKNLENVSFVYSYIFAIYEIACVNQRRSSAWSVITSMICFFGLLRNSIHFSSWFYILAIYYGQEAGSVGVPFKRPDAQTTVSGLRRTSLKF